MEEQVTPSAQIPPEPIHESPTGSKPRVLDELKSWFRDILFAFVTAIFIVIFVVQPVKVEGTSMQPRLVDQERIFVNRFIYRFTDIDRGDVVVFWFPKDPNKSFIKRVLALPGDEVEIRSGAVYVNGAKQDEPYLTREFQDHDSYPRTSFRKHTISFWEITETPVTTAATGDGFRERTFTARRSSVTGRFHESAPSIDLPPHSRSLESIEVQCHERTRA